MKTCAKCKTEKNENEFYKYKHSKDGLNSSCKPCIDIYIKEYNLKKKNNSQFRIYNKRKNTKTPKEQMGYTGKDKQIIRNHMLWLCNKEYAKNPDTAIIEFFGLGELFYHLLKNTKARIKSIDCDDKIGKKLKDIPFTEYATFKKICQQNEKYNILFLDYCGDMTKAVEEDITNATNIMINESTLCLTLCMRTGNYTKNTSRETMESNYIDTVIRILAEKNISTRLNFVVKYAGERINPITGIINRKYPMKFYEFNCKRVYNIQQTIEEMSGDEAKAKLKEYLTRPQFITTKELEERDNTETAITNLITNKLLN